MLAATTHGPVARIRLGRTAFGRTLYEVSAYLLGDLLVDTGPPATAQRFAAWCGERGAARAVLTHHHEDHAGGARALIRRGVRVAAPGPAVEILELGFPMPLYRRVVWGALRPFRAEPLAGTVEAAGATLRVVTTPGHAPDHVVLFEPERQWLFSGDLYVHERVRYLRRDEDVATHLGSLRRALALEPKVLFCGHAGVVEDAGGALRHKIDFLEDLAERAKGLRAAGLPLGEITRRLLGEEGLMTLASRGEFSKRNLVRGLLAMP